jgi:nitrate reductase gamma subunit
MIERFSLLIRMCLNFNFRIQSEGNEFLNQVVLWSILAEGLKVMRNKKKHLKCSKKRNSTFKWLPISYVK